MTTHFNPAELRDAHGRWRRNVAKALLTKAQRATPNLDAALAGHGKRGTGVSKGTVDDPINCAGNVVLAARLLSEGKHIRLNKEAEVGTLLDRLAYLTNEAVKHGEQAPNIDLCRVSIPKTNLFCAKTKGIPRAQMPQLSGVPVKGSKADKLPRVRGGEVDIIPEFRTALAAKGVKVTDTEFPADHLKATQDQIIGPKVAGIYEAMKAAKSDSGLFERIMVTRDGYVIDGHHRWAAQVGLESTKGTPIAEMKMRVSMLDMDIGEALDVSKAFANDWGIPQQGFDLKPDPPGVDLGYDFLDDLVDIDLVRHVRSEAGAKRFGQKIGEVITRDVHTPGLSIHALQVPPAPVKVKKPKKSKWPANPKTVRLNGMDFDLDDAVTMVSEAYDWPFRDKRGGKGSDPESIKQQDIAQIIAKTWTSTEATNAEDAQAQDLWHSYQSPDDYGNINRSLRKNVPMKGADALDGDSPEKMRSLVDLMFTHGGYTTTKPMTVYRALRSRDVPTYEGKPMPAVGVEYPNWAEKLKPGTVFTDNGMISTTAHRRLSEGWLLNDDKGAPNRENRTTPNDVVLEVRVPTGTRVVGGDPQFIETMLRPGSRMKVISSEQTTAHGVDPITANKKTFTATHVVAELLPDGA